MIRKKSFHTFKEAARVGAYDERPMLPDEIDIQLHLSRNDRPQPFFLVCEKDTLIALMSGAARVEFKAVAVQTFELVPGDYVYVPAGTPHRIVPATESVMMRYKPRRPGLEGTAWYCTRCDTEIHREIWDTVECNEQAGYLAASERFNADDRLRTCGRCSETHAKVDIGAFRWGEIAREIAAG